MEPQIWKGQSFVGSAGLSYRQKEKIMAYDVFISYSDKDRLIVCGICAYLEQNGIRCFVAYRDIPKGVIWAGAITDAIEGCQLMVIVYSENFNSSKQVDREIQLCSDADKPMLIFRLCDVSYNNVKKFYLLNINHLDAFPNPEKEFGTLLKSIEALLSKYSSRKAEKINNAREERTEKEKLGSDIYNEIFKKQKESIVQNETVQNTTIKSSQNLDLVPEISIPKILIGIAIILIVYILIYFTIQS